jgi:hypothetical protein
MSLLSIRSATRTQDVLVDDMGWIAGDVTPERVLDRDPSTVQAREHG